MKTVILDNLQIPKAEHHGENRSSNAPHNRGGFRGRGRGSSRDRFQNNNFQPFHTPPPFEYDYPNAPPHTPIPMHQVTY